MRTQTGVAAIAMLAMAFSVGAYATDVETGKAIHEEQCVECHETADWEGESKEAIVEMTNDIVAGKTKHKSKIKLSAEEIQAVAAYWAGANE